MIFRSGVVIDAGHEGRGYESDRADPTGTGCIARSDSETGATRDEKLVCDRLLLIVSALQVRRSPTLYPLLNVVFP